MMLKRLSYRFHLQLASCSRRAIFLNLPTEVRGMETNEACFSPVAGGGFSGGSDAGTGTTRAREPGRLASWWSDVPSRSHRRGRPHREANVPGTTQVSGKAAFFLPWGQRSGSSRRAHPRGQVAAAHNSKQIPQSQRQNAPTSQCRPMSLVLVL